MEHIWLRVCHLLAAGEATAVRREQPHLEMAGCAGAAGGSTLDLDHQDTGLGCTLRCLSWHTRWPGC